MSRAVKKADLIHDEPSEVSIGECTLRVRKTGREEQRGEVSIKLAEYDVGDVSRTFTPEEAEQIGLKLIELAAVARRLSTRGFVGSKE